MKSLTVRLPEALVKGIERESTVRKVSKSVVVRERLGRVGPASFASSTLNDILEECWSTNVPVRPHRVASLKKQKLTEIIRAKKLHRG